MSVGTTLPLEAHVLPRVNPRWVKRLAWLAVIVAVGVVLRLTVLRPKSVPVTVYRVAAGRVEESVTNSRAGTVKSRRRAELSSEIGGRVAELPAQKGSRVSRGTLLMRIADADYRAQVRVQESAVAAARSNRTEICRQAELAERELARNRRLAAEQIVSTEIVDQLQSRRDVAVASCNSALSRIGQAEAALALARANLDKTVLRAPFDGIVADVTTEVGEYITPSPPGLPIPPVIVLYDDAATYVSAPMDEVDVAKLRVGQAARVTLDAYSGRSLPARVTRVAPYVLDVQEQNRTFEIEAELDDAAFAKTLLPGTSADVEVILASRDGVLRIPTYALLEGGRVLVVENRRLAARPIETGLKNWQFAEVTKGLSAGDTVAVSLDRAEVKEGARVSIAGETAK
ncbi:MAG TPA: efflux RND transporter periplasmic adaptor subunit [Thermoanaerobaculia bacterium]|nr:efflux RND transporter periplasmic adaptor subunit [Thermoanaerobaculia bacterium]